MLRFVQLSHTAERFVIIFTHVELIIQEYTYFCQFCHYCQENLRNLFFQLLSFFFVLSHHLSFNNAAINVIATPHVCYLSPSRRKSRSLSLVTGG